MSHAIVPTATVATATAVDAPAVSHRRRTVSRVARVLAATVAVVGLVGCTVPSNNPTSYDEAVQSNFVQGCVGAVPETNNTTTTLASQDYCTCAYRVFEQQVPFDDGARSAFPNYPADAPTFTTFNKDLAKSDNPQSVWDTLPQSIRDDLATCPVPPGPVAPNASTTTTVAGETTTTAAG